MEPELVVLGIATRGTEDAIQVCLDRLDELGLLRDPVAARRALLEREAAHTTALGGGVAVPHATLAGLERPLLVLGIAPAGIAFGPAGVDPVHVVFLLLSPPSWTGRHIKLLARIARLVRHPGFVRRLAAGPSAEAVLEEVGSVDAEHV